MGYPSGRGWYDWPNGQCSYAGGTYYNVYPRACGAHRDAARIVVDMNTGAVWFSPDRYSDFYQL